MLLLPRPLPRPPSLPNAVCPGGCLQIILWVEVTVHKQYCVCTDEVESYTTCGGRGVRGVQGKEHTSLLQGIDGQVRQVRHVCTYLPSC